MKNSIVIATLTISGLAVSLAGCATGPFAQTETPDDEFFEAIQVVEQAERPVEIVETAAVLPLPGQLKPAPDTPSLRPDRGASPMEATRRGTEQARIEPSEEGFINAVQVYPYTEGALYRLYASPGQVSDIALQPGEELISVFCRRYGAMGRWRHKFRWTARPKIACAGQANPIRSYNQFDDRHRSTRLSSRS